MLFESPDPQGDRLRTLAVRRVRFVLRHLTWLGPRAKVQLSDVNGPRGGVDKRCQVELKTDIVDTVVVTSIARDWRCALDRALSRAAQTLMRHLRRGREHDRSGRRAIGFEE